MNQPMRWMRNAPLRAYIEERLPGKLPSDAESRVTVGEVSYILYIYANNEHVSEELNNEFTFYMQLVLFNHFSKEEKPQVR